MVDRRVLQSLEVDLIMKEMHLGVAGGHFSKDIIDHKILHGGYWWPTLYKDVYNYC